MIIGVKKRGIQAGNAQIIGQQDEQNDYFAHLPGASRNSYLAVVADGLTRKKTGKYAAVVSVEILKANFLNGIYEKQGVESYFSLSFEAVSKRLTDNIYSNKTGAALIAAVIQNKYLHYAAVGNCFLYFYRNGEINILNDPGKPEIEIRKIRLQRKDIAMLCSQGVMQSLTEMEILYQLSCKRHPYDKCQRLAKHIQEKGLAYQDNATVIILENMAEGQG